MTGIRFLPARLRFWLILATSLGAASLITWLVLPHPAQRVLILSSSLESRGADLGAGMALLLKDHLEVLAAATVSHQEVLPSANELRQMSPDTWILRFQGRRSGDDLALTTEWTTADRLLKERPWILDSAPAQDPQEALTNFVQRWPLGLHFRRAKGLLPRDQARFWSLLEAMSILDDQAATEHLASTQALVDAEPQCATAWTLLGDHLYRSLWVRPEEAGVGLNSRTHHAFQRALALVPGHPRASFLGSLMLTDTGNQHLALRTLHAALQIRPGIPDLYLGLAYAGRTAGLLAGARKALDKRKALLGPGALPSAWLVETTYLYQGDLEAFSQDLRRVQTVRQDVSILFYQGYLALLQNHPQEALEIFRAGSDPSCLPAPFRDLCRAYRAYLEARPEQGLAELREIDQIRGKLRIPDGEWTFKEAEAYALLGDTDRAMDAATRSFVQGFSCADWFDGSPFLGRARSHPRWATLHRNVRERQAMLEGSFPLAAFGP